MANFKPKSSRSYAALMGLRNGFAELFKRNAHADKADDERIKDYLVQITGRRREDSVLSAILGTFNAIRSFITGDVSSPHPIHVEVASPPEPIIASEEPPTRLGLSYHINIVLPETKDIAVFNAIFQSLKQNLLS